MSDHLTPSDYVLAKGMACVRKLASKVEAAQEKWDKTPRKRRKTLFLDGMRTYTFNLTPRVRFYAVYQSNAFYVIFTHNRIRFSSFAWAVHQPIENYDFEDDADDDRDASFSDYVLDFSHKGCHSSASEVVDYIENTTTDYLYLLGKVAEARATAEPEPVAIDTLL